VILRSVVAGSQDHGWGEGHTAGDIHPAGFGVLRERVPAPHLPRTGTAAPGGPRGLVGFAPLQPVHQLSQRGGNGAMDVVTDDDGELVVVPGPPADAAGHGTACASVIRAIAPGVSLTSVRVLTSGKHGSGADLLTGLSWAIDEGFDVINLSLSTAKTQFCDALRELSDSLGTGETASRPSPCVMLLSRSCDTELDSVQVLLTALTFLAARQANSTST
jgi:hypothetical protein